MSKRLDPACRGGLCCLRCFGFRARQESDGRRRADALEQEHRRERGQLEGSHHARRGSKSGGSRRHAVGKGPFTVFAPTNAAFAKLPAGTVETLVKPENKATLTKILTCHVVAANAMSTAINKMIADDKGTHPVKTVGGCVLQAKKNGNKITLTDEKGGVATVTIADVRQSNGVIHVIDTVLLPAS